jgi:hypothetical protein
VKDNEGDGVTSTRHRTLGVAVLAIGLALGCTACAKEDTAGVATAAEKPATSGAADGGKSWEAYDAAMNELAACYREHGYPAAKYEGHKSTAIEPTKELSGIPDLSKKFYPVVQQCMAKEPKKGVRPEPYAALKASPQDIKDLRAVAKCMRAMGLTDVRDPNSDGSNGLWGDGTAKAGQLTPEQRKYTDAEKACYKKLSIAQPGENSDGSVG